VAVGGSGVWVGRSVGVVVAVGVNVGLGVPVGVAVLVAVAVGVVVAVEVAVAVLVDVAVGVTGNMAIAVAVRSAAEIAGVGVSGAIGPRPIIIARIAIPITLAPKNMPALTLRLCENLGFLTSIGPSGPSTSPAVSFARTV